MDWLMDWLGKLLNNIVINQAHITCQASMKNKLVNIDNRNHLTLTNHLDAT